MMFMLFNSNTTGITSGAGIANISGAHEFTSGYYGFITLHEVMCRHT